MKLEEGDWLVGVVTTPDRVEAQVVEWTPFGRLRRARRRLVEDVMSPPGFRAAPVSRQLARVSASPKEEQAADSWVQSVAGAVEQLLFGLRGGQVRLGVAVEGWLDARGEAVLAARGGPRVSDWPARLTTTLRARSIPLREPVRAVCSRGAAAALGEVWSPLGALAGGGGGLVLDWGLEHCWAEVTGTRVLREGIGRPGAAGAPGLAELRRSWQEGRSGVASLDVELGRRRLDALEHAAEAAFEVGQGAASRLLERLQRASAQPPAPAPGSRGGDVVVTGGLARLLGEPIIRASMEQGLVQRLLEREDASMAEGWLERVDGRATLGGGVLRQGADGGGALVGAAAWSLRDRLPSGQPTGGAR